MRFLAMILFLLMGPAALAQETDAPASPTETAETAPDRSATGGATTLEDIMARQRGEKIDNSYRSENTGAGHAAAIDAQLGTLGGASQSDVYRALRFGSADITSSARGPAADVVIQDGGMWWLTFREGPLLKYGAWLLGGMIAVLALFYLIRGKIRIEGEKTGRKLLRFTSFERFGHWLFAGSFLVLGVTGLISLFGRTAIIPLLGKDAFSTVALACKWVHNNVAWAFMLGLLIVIVNWTLHNFPNRHDLKWLAQAGGLFSKGVHPPARKFNAGQKLIFWGCVVLGLSISISGLSLLFPFQMPLFGKTFAVANASGISELFGLGALPETLSPQQEMQFAQLWHAIVAFIFMAMILAHIYLGSVGMEGAYDAVSTGEVDEQWAREHHSLWVEEMMSGSTAKIQDPPPATPAE